MQTQLPSAATRVPTSLLLDPPTRGAELVTRDGRSLPLVSAKLHADAQGGIARVVLEQRFENRYDETLHVTYRMPLPADGAVSGYAFQIAGRTITGRIDRKHAARERFERAVASGKTAALLEQDRSDIFTQSIGNLPAREALVAFIAVDVKLAWLPEGEWELRFPTVIGPRYVGASDLPAEVRASAITTAPEGVGARIQIAVKIGDALRPGRAPGSPSHALQVGRDGLVELRDVAGAKLDRDIVVRWPVAGAAVGLALQLARPADRDETFGLLTIVPPAREVNHRALARDLIVLIDTSGSMSCGPLDKAKRVVSQLIESLGDDDRLELIEFSSTPRPYRSGPVLATGGEKQAAIRWVRGLTAGGSTEMRAAVIAAMRSLRPGAQRQVVLATDGYIGGEEQIIQQLYRDLPASCRLHFVGVGSAVNRSLSTAMARAGRGAEVLCDLDEDVERAAQRIIDRTRMPILTNVTLEGSALIAQAPELLPDVFEGAPFVAAVQLRAGELVVRGELARERWEQRIAVRPGAAGNQAIVALFGRERVADLEARRAVGESRDAEIEGLGLTFQIATRLTSWIAVDEVRVTTGPSRHDDMPQALPYGTTAAAFGLRSAAPAFEEDPVSALLRSPGAMRMVTLSARPAPPASMRLSTPPPASRNASGWVTLSEAAPPERDASGDPFDDSVTGEVSTQDELGNADSVVARDALSSDAARFSDTARYAVPEPIADEPVPAPTQAELDLDDEEERSFLRQYDSNASMSAPSARAPASYARPADVGEQAEAVLGYLDDLDDLDDADSSAVIPAWQRERRPTLTGMAVPAPVSPQQPEGFAQQAGPVRPEAASVARKPAQIVSGVRKLDQIAHLGDAAPKAKAAPLAQRVPVAPRSGVRWQVWLVLAILALVIAALWWQLGA